MFNSNNSAMPFTMPVVPASGSSNSGNGNNDGWGRDGAWWIIILFLFVFCGWGNGNWGGNGNGGNSGVQYIPYSFGNTDAEIQRNFDTQSITNKLDAMTNGMCQQGYQELQSFNGVDNAICTLGNQIQNGVNDINTSMLQGFNSTNTALLQGQNALSTQIANCCCEEREAIQNVNYNMATQACNIQNAMNNNTRDIIESQQSGTRQILDYLCNQKIEDLQSENQSLKLAASQSAQNNYLASLSNAQTAELINRISPIPVPSFQVNPPFPYCGCGHNH